VYPDIAVSIIPGQSGAVVPVGIRRRPQTVARRSRSRCLSRPRRPPARETRIWF